MRSFSLIASVLLCVGCTQHQKGAAHLTQATQRLSEVEFDTEQLKRSLAEVKVEHEAALSRLTAYTRSLDSLQKGCAEARAIEEMAKEAKSQAQESEKRADEITHLRSHVTDTVRLVEQTQKKVQALESHLQSYWGKIDRLLALKNEVENLKSQLEGKSAPTNTVTYTVESGDSLDFIARKFRVQPAALSQMNNISNAELKPGQKLYIPKGL